MPNTEATRSPSSTGAGPTPIAAADRLTIDDAVPFDPEGTPPHDERNELAPLAIDGDPATFWQPAADDPLGRWVLDIDLGRVVLARHIRLVFPDREGARPLGQFTVYATTGARIRPTEDVFRFDAAYRTTQPNRQTEIVIPLDYVGTDSTVVLDGNLGLDLERESHYRLVQYISIVAEEKNPEAALAEYREAAEAFRNTLKQ